MDFVTATENTLTVLAVFVTRLKASFNGHHDHQCLDVKTAITNFNSF